VCVCVCVCVFVLLLFCWSADGNGLATADGPHLQMPARWFGGSDFSICLWINFQRFNFWSRVLDWGNGHANNNIVLNNVIRTNGMRFEIFQNSISRALEIEDFWAPTSTWAHTCFTASGSTTSATMRAYRNGVLMGTQAAGWLPPVVRRSTFYIGRNSMNFPDDQYFNGYMDDLRIYSYALSAAEVDALYKLR
jgi:hypothetical protein